MADMLARPRIAIHSANSLITETVRVTVPLWIEVKSGADKLTYEQEAFRHYVVGNGEHFKER